MFVKVVASPSGNKFQHRIQPSKDTSGRKGPTRSTSGSFGGTPSTAIAHPKKRSVVSSSSQLKFTALAQMAETRNRSLPATSGETTASDGCQTDNLIPPPVTLRKSESMQSLRRVGRRVRDNHCCVALFFFFFGLLFNGVSYWISVQTAQLNSEVVDAAVANHETSRFNLKKALVNGPSKYIIGLFSFLGRVTSAVGTFFLAQAVVTWLQKRRSNTLRSAAGHADEAIGEVHGGCAEIVADCFTQCIPAFG